MGQNRRFALSRDRGQSPRGRDRPPPQPKAAPLSPHLGRHIASRLAACVVSSNQFLGPAARVERLAGFAVGDRGDFAMPVDVIAPADCAFPLVAVARAAPPDIAPVLLAGDVHPDARAVRKREFEAVPEWVFTSQPPAISATAFGCFTKSVLSFVTSGSPNEAG